MSYTYIYESDALDQYRDAIDDSHDVEICGMSFNASRVLEELDPIAFNCGFNDWLDANDLTTELISYKVELVEPDAEADDIGDYPTFIFQCEAESEEHAKEQAEDAYPDADILDIVEA